MSKPVAPDAALVTPPASDQADLERRFGGLRRLYGAAGYERIRAGRVAIVGVGGVGSWAAEALARCGVAHLSLIDFDHIAESNINRQIHALDSSLGQAKVHALKERIAQIHPGCRVQAIDAFVTPQDWPALLAERVDVVIDACDDPKAKLTLAIWALQGHEQDATPLILVGAAGGKRDASRVAVGDLVDVTHDPLLAQLRQRLRKQGLIAAAVPRLRRCGLTCIYSSESVARPLSSSDPTNQAVPAPGGFAAGLNCAGYGSVVTVTASFGLLAADQALTCLTRASAPS